MLNSGTKEERELDEQLFAIVAEEMEKGIINKGLWTKALAEANGDDNKTSANYIKLRVIKLKDDVAEERRKLQKKAQEENAISKELKKASDSLEILDTTVQKNISIFKWLSTAMFVVGFVGMGLSYILSAEDYSFEIIGIFSGLLTLLSLYLFYLCFQITKFKDLFLIKKRLNLFFWIFIPFTMLGLVTGVFAPLLGIASFFISISLMAQAYKFNNAFTYAVNKNLLRSKN